jgi:hypothetical protein
MSDYEWFEKEVAAVPWSTFYILKRSFDHKCLTKAGIDPNSLPKEYFEFIERYGEARLFRSLKSDSHFLTILFPKPKPEFGLGTYLIGGYWEEGRAYVVEGKEGIFLSNDGSRLHEVSETFDLWFQRSFRKAKDDVRKTYWPILHKPPVPFSDTEQDIAEAISRYKFSKLAVESNGDLKIEIQNEAERTLRWVKMGVAAPMLSGAIELEVGDLKPGRSKVITRGCYKEVVSPQSVSLFSFPKPTPEDRFAFKELRLLNGLE